jgi:predicted aldo/keto reductase-like oxidoreductase
VDVAQKMRGANDVGARSTTTALSVCLPISVSANTAAQRWILDHDAVSTVITGASRPEQATAKARVSNLPPLTPRLHKKLRDFYERKVKQHIRGPVESILSLPEKEWRFRIVTVP